VTQRAKRFTHVVELAQRRIEPFRLRGLALPRRRTPAAAIGIEGEQNNNDKGQCDEGSFHVMSDCMGATRL